MIRTVEQYLESLRDGRVLYHLGERVKDATRHPVLARNVWTGAIDWALPNDPSMRHLFVTKDADGEDINFLWTQPRNTEELVRKREAYVEGARFGGMGCHSMGVDALASSTVVSKRIDAAMGTHYSENVEAYRKHLQKTDIGITGAQTDVKGDRHLHAAAQVQHKDFYVRVVDRQKDGIIVRGAKYHISFTPASNEAIVLPCRAHGEEDKDYAVVFATPLNAKGITLISAEPELRQQRTEETDWDHPYASKMNEVGGGECMIVFDDVFVPWEKVFMCGEWQFSRDMARAFGTFHRLFACSRMCSAMENMTGVAALMAEYNGLESYPHIRAKLAYLAQVTETLKIVSKAACMFPQPEPGTNWVNPDPMYTNIAKYVYASNYHEVSKVVQDISGGIVADPISYRDWANPAERPYIEKYLGGKAGIPTEHRLRAIKLVTDMTGGKHVSHNIHAEGSLATQEMMFYASANWDFYKAAAKRLASIPGWETNAVVKKQKDYADIIKAKMPPLDTNYVSYIKK
ncbi:MAG: 4-hydroxyphenylacetate 3-hydroxylase N-terminal domain-containing protein [Dehalococcoidales bacterium]|nr:4-hydroxyphenylacetate 3-hydroxylase N-terminal domain-containing protein [Dehalococcoidales bacterium]